MLVLKSWCETLNLYYEMYLFFEVLPENHYKKTQQLARTVREQKMILNKHKTVKKRIRAKMSQNQVSD